jgi:hypothetical protein
MKDSSAILFRTILFLMLVASAVTRAAGTAAPPAPPCESVEPYPPYVDAREAAPETWSRLEWRAPTCLGWSQARYKYVIAIAARIRAPSDVALKARMGAVSGTRGLRYWSVTEGAWRVLIKDASALSAAQGERRADFAPAEMRAGAVLYFVEEDNRSSAPVTYAMRVLESGPARIVIETENVTPIKAALVTFFPPGSLRAAYIMTRLTGDTWGFYAISAATDKASSLVALAQSSYVNRARAFFAHFSGASVTSP